MSGKNKKKEKERVVRLYSSESTGFFYLFKKPKNSIVKPSLLKYDPVLRRRVAFKERK